MAFVLVGSRFMLDATLRNRDKKDETVNGILQYQKTPKDTARKSDGNGQADKRGFRQAG